MDLNRRLTPQEVADLVRELGLEVVGDDVAWIAKHGVVLDFPLTGSGEDAADGSVELDETHDDEDQSDDSRPESLLYLVGFLPPVFTVVSEPDPEAAAPRSKPQRRSNVPHRLARITTRVLRRIRRRHVRTLS